MHTSPLKTLQDDDVDADYEVTGDFDEMLEIDEFDELDNEPVAATAHELGAWVEERAVD